MEYDLRSIDKCLTTFGEFFVTLDFFVQFRLALGVSWLIIIKLVNICYL